MTRSIRSSSPSDQAWNGHPRGCMRGVAVGDLRDVAEAGLVEVGQSGSRKRRRASRLRLVRAAAHADPGVHERAGQIRPDRPLVVRAVALARRRLVAADVARDRRATASASRAASRGSLRRHRRRGARARLRGSGTAGRRRRRSGSDGTRDRPRRAGDPRRRRRRGSRAASFQNRVVERGEPRSCRSRQRSENAVAAHRAFNQSACTSTGLPMRGVTTQSPTFASIHVSCTPGSPAASSPSASARMPKRVPRA